MLKRKCPSPKRGASAGMVALAAVSLVSGCVAPGSQEAQPTLAAPTPHPAATPAVDARVVDFAGTGAVPDQFTIIDRSRNASGLRIDNGRLTHGRALRDNAAVYFFVSLAPKTVSEIGAVVDLSATTEGSFALLVGTRPVPVDAVAPAPATAVHFVADAQGWVYGIWKPGAAEQTILAQGKYASDFDRSAASFSVQLVGDVATVVLPDGTALGLSDPRIAEYAGTFATWELFEASAGAVPVAFRKVWVN